MLLNHTANPAIKSGVAYNIIDLDKYRETLEQRVAEQINNY